MTKVVLPNEENGYDLITNWDTPSQTREPVDLTFKLRRGELIFVDSDELMAFNITEVIHHGLDFANLEEYDLIRVRPKESNVGGRQLFHIGYFLNRSE